MIRSWTASSTRNMDELWLGFLSNRKKYFIPSRKDKKKKKKKAEITLAFEATSFSLAECSDKFLEIEQDQDIWDKILP